MNECHGDEDELEQEYRDDEEALANSWEDADGWKEY